MRGCVLRYPRRLRWAPGSQNPAKRGGCGQKNRLSSLVRVAVVAGLVAATLTAGCAVPNATYVRQVHAHAELLIAGQVAGQPTGGPCLINYLQRDQALTAEEREILLESAESFLRLTETAVRAVEGRPGHAAGN